MSDRAGGTMSDFAARAAAFMAENPDIEIVELVFPDMNGLMRGKWLPAAQIGKLAEGAVRMPKSSYNLDIASEDVAEAKIAVDIGDPDGIGWPIAHAFGRALWLDRPTAIVLMTMTEPDGVTPCIYDPRQALARITARLAERGITAVVAPELEFYLVDGETDAAGRALPPRGIGGERLGASQVYMLDVKHAFGHVLAEIDSAARALGAPADAATAEFGPGQFEINLAHSEDPLAAADHAVLLRRAIRGVARRHGMDACFMAKPYGDQSGSGQHFHVSLRDTDGRNLFAAEGGAVAPMMRAAVGGLIETMAECTLVFAPHLNAYRRLRPGTYAPCVAAWGLDNRGTAVRCPATEGAAARIEHRVAGADANPYLALTAILAGMLRGIERNADPGEPATGEPRATVGSALPAHWPTAITAFEASRCVRETFGAEFARVYALMKQQEMARLLGRVTDAEYDTYLRTL